MFATYHGQHKPTSPVTSRRKVFANAMVAHVWAQQTHDAGRSGNGNFYFSGATIYSYGSHFPIASFTSALFDTRRVVLFNNENRSVSTSGHQRYTRSALDDLPVRIFYVPNIAPHPDAADHAGNINRYVDAFNTSATRLAKPHVRDWFTDKDRRPGESLDMAQIIANRCAALDAAVFELHAYCEAFNLERHDVGLGEAKQKIRDAFERYNDPKRVAKREATRGRNGGDIRHYRAMSRAHAFLEGVTDAKPNIAFVPYRIEGGLKRRIQNEIWNRERAARAAREGARCVAVTPSEWTNGEGYASQSFYATLVRRKGDKLETSRGAECPFAHAVVAFLKAQECRATGTTWHRNGQQIRVGHFNVDSIDEHGNMRAGCHTLEWVEMLRLAIREVPHLVKASFGLPVVSHS